MILMEYCGKSLDKAFIVEGKQQFIKKHEPLALMEPVELIRMMHSVLKGLGYMHQLGLIHHDIKPGNVAEQEHFKIIDFGDAAPRRQDAVHGGQNKKKEDTFANMPWEDIHMPNEGPSFLYLFDKMCQEKERSKHEEFKLDDFYKYCKTIAEKFRDGPSSGSITAELLCHPIFFLPGFLKLLGRIGTVGDWKTCLRAGTEQPGYSLDPLFNQIKLSNRQEVNDSTWQRAVETYTQSIPSTGSAAAASAQPHGTPPPPKPTLTRAATAPIPRPKATRRRLVEYDHESTEQRISRRLAEESRLLHDIVPDFANKLAALSPFERKLYELHHRRLAEGRRLTEADIPRSYTHTAEEVLARRRLIDGDRTPVGLAVLMSKIEAAQERDRRLRR